MLETRQAPRCLLCSAFQGRPRPEFTKQPFLLLCGPPNPCKTTWQVSSPGEDLLAHPCRRRGWETVNQGEKRLGTRAARRATMGPPQPQRYLLLTPKAGRSVWDCTGPGPSSSSLPKATWAGRGKVGYLWHAQSYKCSQCGDKGSEFISRAPGWRGPQEGWRLLLPPAPKSSAGDTIVAPVGNT